MTDYSTIFSITDQLAVVTGGSGVLCSEMARGLATFGARIILIGRNRDKLQKIADSINRDNPRQETGLTAYALSCDVTDVDELATATNHIVDQYGIPDILINGAGGSNSDAVTAGMTVDDNSVPTFFDLKPDALRQVVDLNLFGTILPCQIIGKVMTQQRHGCIINVASMASYRPATRVAGYSAAKAAVVNFTQWLSTYFAPSGIRVNAIAPGFFVTEQNSHLLLDKVTGKSTLRGERILDHTPMRRFGQAEDLVGATVYLASKAAQFVTGSVVAVDGGFSAYGGV